MSSLASGITKTDTVHQCSRTYVRREKMSNLYSTLIANMSTGGHNVPLILQNMKLENSFLENVLHYKVLVIALFFQKS